MGAIPKLLYEPNYPSKSSFFPSWSSSSFPALCHLIKAVVLSPAVYSGRSQSVFVGYVFSLLCKGLDYVIHHSAMIRQHRYRKLQSKFCSSDPEMSSRRFQGEAPRLRTFMFMLKNRARRPLILRQQCSTLLFVHLLRESQIQDDRSSRSTVGELSPCAPVGAGRFCRGLSRSAFAAEHAGCDQSAAYADRRR